MKNIGIIVPSLKGGGAERVASLLSQRLSEKHNVYLIIFNGEGMAYEYGGKLIDLKIEPHPNYMFKVKNVIERIREVKNIKKLYNIDITYSFLYGPNIVNVLSRKDDKIVISVRSHLSKGKKTIFSGVNKLLIKNIYKRADQIVAISKGVAADLVKNYGLNKELISYIHNPIDNNLVKNLSNESFDSNLDLYSNSFVITSVGRLTNAKGQWHLIRSLIEVKKEIKSFKLLILGQGELEEYLKQLVVDLKLEEYVMFLGFQKNPFRYIKRSDLFVLSSLYEGFGNVIIEAMACGTPIIATDCRSGPREILAPKTDVNKESREIEYEEYGVLVPVCDGNHYDYNDPLTIEEKLLAQSIIDLYNNKKMRDNYSKKALERVKDFEIDNISTRWEELIE